MIEITADLTWEILKMDAHTVDQQHGVVLTIHWCLTGTQNAELKTHYGYTYGSVDLPYEPSDNFVPFEQLDKNTVLAWLWNKIDKTQHEELVQREINQKITPLTVSPKLPWSN